MTRLLDAVAIWKRFSTLAVLQGVDISVTPGECLVLLGPSGSGKSTLLRCLNLLEPIGSGSIIFEGREIANTPRKQAALLRRRMGMVFQNFELFQHLSAADNIAFGPIRVKQAPVKQARELAHHLLRKVHLPDKAAAFPDELSGGQQQRVAIARALAMDPVLMLYDEPTSALDPETVGEVLTVMQELAEEGMTSIVVTHELGFARRAANEVMFMEAGRVAHRAPVGDFFNGGAPDRVVRFLNRMHT
ncbi:MAG TPA: amino acid ABC transporter ATP-binding protein [Acetobacteraceae bacterium]|nr:amino acid ABC transporter ATP-binding protein [Acetobacteraceae bacterium]